MKFANFKPTAREAEEKVTRMIVKFAWWPISCDDGHTYWLRHVVIERQAYLGHQWHNGDFGYGDRRRRGRILSKLPKHKLPKATARLKRDREQ